MSEDEINYKALSQKQLLLALGLDRNTLVKWESYGCPCHGAGRTRRFSLREVWDWRIKHERESAERKGVLKSATLHDDPEMEPEAGDSPNLEKKRYWGAKNEEIKYKQAISELFSREEIYKQLSFAGDQLRSHLMNVGAELSVPLSRTADALEIQELIERKIEDALQLLGQKIDEFESREEEVYVDKAG